MHVAFRADASLYIGTGHVMRCLTLADAMRESGAQCSFVCRPNQYHLLDFIAQRGHQVLVLPALEDGAKPNLNGTAHADWLGTDSAIDAVDTEQVLRASMGNKLLDWLIVDHYALEMSWEQTLRSSARRIMVIDDLADRPHACDLLLDQNLGRNAQDYEGLLKRETTKLIGPQYAILRPEFSALRSQSLARRKNVFQLRYLLITMGGADKDNATGQVLDALKASSLPANLRITVVLGLHAPWLEEVKAQAAQMPWNTEVLVGGDNMAKLMAESDLAIGAAGSTSWERCCLGLPAIQIVLAQNQEFIASALSEAGAALTLRRQEIAQGIPEVLKCITVPDRYQVIAKNCSTITQGRGAQLLSRYMKGFNEDNALM